jgi:predicted Zn finger-like uncharacterized protein
LVVTCEKCSTRFRLDESRIPPTGARVRCSRCKHAFFLAPTAGPGDAAAVHAIVAETLAGAPAPTEDLGDALGPERESTARSEREPETLEDEDESRWEFSEQLRNEDPDEPAAEPVPTAREPIAAPAAPSAAPEAASAAADAAPGNPESWDLLDDPDDPDAAPRLQLEIEEHRSSAPEPRGPLASPERSVQGRAMALPAVVEPGARATASVRRGRAAAALGALGWLGVLALVAVALEAVFFPRRLPAVAHPLRAGSFTAYDLRGRFVENAVAGPLFVVSAELRNRATSPQAPGEALRVVLLARDGSRVPSATAWVAPALAEGQLREATPETIQSELERGARDLARTALPADAGVRVDAVFERVPPKAERFALEEVPISELPVEATGDGTAAESDTAATESASLPSLPSSPE